jgi:hypothetical protein
VAIFTGLWIGLLVPYVMNRNTKRMMREAGEAGEAGDGGP